MIVPAVVLRWLERQVGRTVTLSDGRRVTLHLVDACSGEPSLCVEVPGVGLVWIGLDEIGPLASNRERKFNSGAV